MAAPTTSVAKSLRVDRVISAGAFSAIHTTEQIIVLPARPSARAARTATGCLSQVAAVRLTIEGGVVRAAVSGIDHRLPVTRPCSVPAALALAGAGVTTVVTTDGSVGEGEGAPTAEADLR